MSNGDLVRTGITGLDDIFLGGIPRGNVILIEGEAGAGKTLLGIEFIYRGIVEYDEPGIIVVFENSPRKLLRDVANFNWNLEELQQQNRLRIIFTTPQVLEQELRSADSLLIETATELGARRIFIDGIALLRPTIVNGGSPLSNGPSSYRELLQQIIEGIDREGLTAIFSHELATRGEPALTLDVAEFLADTVISLKRGDYSQGIYRCLEILKSRGQDFEAGVHTLRITSGRGLEVFRRVQCRVQMVGNQPTSTVQRSVIGSTPLDDLTGGGLYNGSVTLVVGASGTGKSVLGYQVLVEGARNLGKRSLLVTLDEHPEQILRNADSLGLNMREQVETEMIHILHDSPLELEVNVHFDLIVRTIEEQQIERIVVDGITTYSNAIHDQRVFREFFHALIAFTKNRLMTTFISYENPELFGVTHFMTDSTVTSVVDNVILLSYVELGNVMHRAITVAKARGCNHQYVTREYRIDRGGIILSSEESIEGQNLPFGSYYNLLSRAPTRFNRSHRSFSSEIDE
ncbi:AAA family ATPase [Scytonema sp. UIC 10036]|uniref:ATPase domain-containing protein n=1 Tax=Scytonema sp. UIC 10036 TaxID=2304196 RepID=UPI001383F301|nr:AAA family ATPase [Scytonema sp. UIC 10036]